MQKILPLTLATEINHVKLASMSKTNNNFLPLILIVFIDSLAYFLVIPVLLVVIIKPGSPLLDPHSSHALRYTLYSIALALSPLAFLIASPWVGHLSDRYGRKKTLFYCLLAGIIGFVLPIIGIITNRVSLVLLGRFIAGASTSSQPIAQAAITDFSHGRQKAYFLSLIAFAMTAAMVLGPILGSLLINTKQSTTLSATLPYWLGAVLAIANIILLVILYTDTTNTTNTTTKIDHRHTLKNSLLKKPIVLLMLTFLALEIGWSLYYQSIYLILDQQEHYSTIQIGLFVGYIGIWMSLGLTVIFRWLIKRYHLNTILLSGIMLSCIGLVICSVMYSSAGQWVGVIPASIGTGIAYPCILALLSNHTTTNHQGWILGCASTVLAASWMVTGFASGLLASLSLRLPIIISCVFFIISLGMNVIRRRHAPT